MKTSKYHSYRIFILVSIFVLLTSSGCRQEPSQSNKATEITLTPIDLFKGEGAKFRPFMGAMSGAFQLRYKGVKPHATLDLDIWQNGKKVANAGSIGDLFFTTEDQDRQEIEAIISIDKVSFAGKGEFQTIKVGTQTNSGSSIATFTVPWDPKLTAQGLIYDSKPRTFYTDEPVYVWGMHATSTNEIRTSDFSPEALSSLEWAIIFTLRFD